MSRNTTNQVRKSTYRLTSIRKLSVSILLVSLLLSLFVFPSAAADYELNTSPASFWSTLLSGVRSVQFSDGLSVSSMYDIPEKSFSRHSDISLADHPWLRISSIFDSSYQDEYGSLFFQYKVEPNWQNSYISSFSSGFFGFCRSGTSTILPNAGSITISYLNSDNTSGTKSFSLSQLISHTSPGIDTVNNSTFTYYTFTVDFDEPVEISSIVYSFRYLASSLDSPNCISLMGIECPFFTQVISSDTLAILSILLQNQANIQTDGYYIFLQDHKVRIADLMAQIDTFQEYYLEELEDGIDGFDNVWLYYRARDEVDRAAFPFWKNIWGVSSLLTPMLLVVLLFSAFSLLVFKVRG